MKDKKKLVTIRRGKIRLCEVVRPTTCYRDLEHYRQEICRHHAREWSDPTFWPCLVCLGCGWIYDPKERPCPVEGNKMRSKLDCLACNTTGRGHKQLVEALYRKQLVETITLANKFDRKLEVFVGAIRKLSTEEVDVLTSWLGTLERNPYSTYDIEEIEI